VKGLCPVLDENQHPDQSQHSLSLGLVQDRHTTHTHTPPREWRLILSSAWLMHWKINIRISQSQHPNDQTSTNERFLHRESLNRIMESASSSSIERVWSNQHKWEVTHWSLRLMASSIARFLIEKPTSGSEPIIIIERDFLERAWNGCQHSYIFIIPGTPLPNRPRSTKTSPTEIDKSMNQKCSMIISRKQQQPILNQVQLWEVCWDSLTPKWEFDWLTASIRLQLTGPLKWEVWLMASINQSTFNWRVPPNWEARLIISIYLNWRVPPNWE